MEEIIAELQADPGDQSKQWALMQRNRGLVYTIAIKYRGVLERCPSVDLEDLLQVGSLALVPAALSYDICRGKSWASWAAWYIHREARKALGFRYTLDDGKQKAAPPPVLVALDGPVKDGDPESGALIDMVEDPAAIDPQEAAERVNLSALVREKVAALPDRQAQTISAYDLDGVPMTSISSAWGVSVQCVSDLRARGFKKLRRSCARLWKEEYHRDYLRHKTVSAFYRTGSSVVEDLALHDL